MDFSQFSIPRHPIFLLISQIIIILLSLIFIEYVYFTDIRPDKAVAATFKQTDCVVTEKKLETRGNLILRYRADFLVNYSVSGKSYQSWVSGNGLNDVFILDKKEEENLLKQHNIGQSYLCWYDPQSPEKVILILRHDWTSIFPLFLPLVIILIVLYYLSRTIFYLLPIKKS